MSDKEDLNESELNRLNSIHSHLINDDEYTRIKYSRELNFFNYNRNVKECLDNLAKLTGQLLKVSTASYLFQLWLNRCIMIMLIMDG